MWSNTISRNFAFSDCALSGIEINSATQNSNFDFYCLIHDGLSIELNVNDADEKYAKKIGGTRL